MKQLAQSLLYFLCSLGCTLAADSVVVFNEVQYHPATNEVANEWIELHNPMAIDIDLSAWSVTGTIGFTFPEGTIILGGGYLVIASDPAALRAATGISNVVGPFTGRLDNSVGTLRLRDRNDRLMDALEYRDGGKWPVAPDGSGATLAKRDPELPSDAPEHWTSSVRVGGTPGARNFPAPVLSQRRSLVAFDALWRYEASGTDLGASWHSPSYDDSSWAGRNQATLVSYWPFDGNAGATRGASGTLVGAVKPAVDRNGVAGGALGFTGASQQYVSVPGGGGLNAAGAGTISLWVKWTGTQDADCCGTYGAVLARQNNGVFSDDIIALTAANPASARVTWRQTGAGSALITGTTVVGTNWHHLAVTFASSGSTLYLDGVVQGTGVGAALNSAAGVPLSIGAWAGDGGGFATASLDDVAIWDKPLTAAQISELAAQTKGPLDFAAAESAVYFAGAARLPGNEDLLRTRLPLGPTTYYFRNTFEFAGDPAQTELTLDLAADDGAVVYLNDAEVYRHNLPEGPVGYGTTAVGEVGDTPILNGLALAATNLVLGANLLAVEVHSAALTSTGLVFGAGLSARAMVPRAEETDPGGLVFNELSAAGMAPFQIELINGGTQEVDTAGYVLRRSGLDAACALPAQTVAPGEFLVLDQGALGFGVAPGDKLFLFLPGGRGVADAVEAHERPRARWPDGAGEWLTPDALTLGASNRVALHDEVVINEIMYHAPPTLEVPAVIGTNTLLTLTNVWCYEQSGADLGTEWRATDYDDGLWPAGPALLYVSTNNLPAAKNTPLTLGPTTYYFRTAFLYTGTPKVLALSLRYVVDDGAVFYWNGNEIYRYNLPGGAITATNCATSGVLNATLRGPISVALTNLVLGTNVLAVEVHQALNTGNDVAFGAELTATVEVVPRVPFAPSAEQWVELFNRAGHPLDLTGWRFDEGIDFRFAPGTRIAPGGFLVVAKDPAALLANFTGIDVVGPFNNSLSHSGERIVLRDAQDNPANAVRYFDGGRWPGAADAGGASLELRDPRADNSAGEAWAASDERSRRPWRTYSYRGVAAASAVGPDGQWREFVMGLLASGEVLLDDISVIETPGATPVQLIQNGTFETGTNKWRIIGSHHGEVIDDPDQPGNKVLRLVATSGTEHMSNHGETTLANSRDVVNGREYQVSFRAKWIRGSRQLNTRLYFNRLARTTLLEAPALHGTPGAQNSAFVTNLGPTCHEFRHAPAVPAPFVPVTVSARAADPDGVAAMTLWWSLEGRDWRSVPMTLGASAFGAEYSANIPGKAAGTIVQFYVQGADARGASSMFPAAGPNARALYKVDDGLAATNGLHNIRLVVRPDDADWLQNNLNVMSNDKIGCTMIYDEREIFYGAGLRLKGSEHSRTVVPRLGFNVNLPSDHLFRGAHPELGIDRSESTGFGQREMLIHQTLDHCGGVPTKYSDLIQVIAPRREHTSSAELQLARYSDIYLDDQYEHGSDGTMFEYELIYQLMTTDTGTPEGNKVPAPDSVVGTTIRNLGDVKETYRWNFLIKNNEDHDDYSRLVVFCKTMELSGTNYNAQITNVIDVDQWLRSMAATALSGAGDNYGGDGAQHNAMFYVRPSDGRVLYFPHDVDAFFDGSRPIVPNSDVSKLISVPARARAYYGHLLDIIATTYNGNYMTRWANHFKRLLPAQDFAGHLAFLVQRASFVTSQVNSAVPNAAFAITSNSGRNFVATNDTITLAGTAPLSVQAIEINGVSYPLTWTTTTAWSLRLPLFNGINALVAQGVGRTGLRLSNALDTIVITNNGAGAFLPVVINEWMADNAGPAGYPDPADGLCQDWFELFNPNTNAVNLSGFGLTDTPDEPAKWQIPAGTIIGPRDFLLVWADNQPEQNIAGASGDLHAGFQLNLAGEAIGLFSPEGVAQHLVGFGRQAQNVSQGLFPDGDTNTVYFMTNWTPRAANTLAGPLRLSGITLGGGVVTLSWSAVPGRVYQVQFTDSLAAPEWMPLGEAVVAAGDTGSITGALPLNTPRFYRVWRSR